MFYCSAHQRIRKKIGQSFLLLSIALLGACGGGGTATNNPDAGFPDASLADGVQTGRFVDSAVSGLGYRTASQSGVTGANGEYLYLPGETISFFIGDIDLGQVIAAPLISPVSLMSDPSDTENLAALQLAQLLQTLDEDANPENGIVISQAVFEAAIGEFVSFGLSGFEANTAVLIERLTELTSAGIREITPLSVAREHLERSLVSERSGVYTGTYSGTLNSPEGQIPWGGTWEMVVDPFGLVSGFAIDQEGEQTSFNGAIDSSGFGVTGSSGDGASFSVSISYEGVVSGTWEAIDMEEPEYFGSGDITGQKDASRQITPGDTTTAQDVGAQEANWPPAKVYGLYFGVEPQATLSFNYPELETEDDQHWWSFSGKDNTFFFFVKTGENEQASDALHFACEANIYNQDGTLIFSINPIQYIQADDGYHKNCEVIFTPPDNNVYYLRVKSSDAYPVKQGPYTLIATRDEHTEYSTGVNMSRSYTVEGKVLNRRYKLSRSFVLPDITQTKGSFSAITRCDITQASVPLSSFECPRAGFYDASGQVVKNGPEGTYRMDVNFGSLFWDRSSETLGDYRLYDWSVIPTYRITIENPVKLPNYDPEYPFCAEASSESICTTVGVGGNPPPASKALFSAYNLGWETGDAIPSSLTCAALGYPPAQIINLSGISRAGGARGTCRFAP